MVILITSVAMLLIYGIASRNFISISMVINVPEIQVMGAAFNEHCYDTVTDVSQHLHNMHKRSLYNVACTHCNLSPSVHIIIIIKLEGHSVEPVYLQQRCFDGRVNKSILKSRVAAATGQPIHIRGIFPT